VPPTEGLQGSPTPGDVMDVTRARHGVEPIVGSALPDLSAKRRRNAGHFGPPWRGHAVTMLAVEKSVHPLPRTCARRPRPWARPLALAALSLAACVAAIAQPGEPWTTEVQQLASQAAVPSGARIEVEVGALDPRLKLAPCTRITPYLPNGMRLWGRSRVGLRCDEGARWNVFVPVTVKVFGKAWAATQPLPAGSTIEAAQLQLQEVDLAADPSPLIRQPEAAIGRTLMRPLRPGQAVRETDLKARQWFAAGDTVRVVTVGSGFAISADGQALSPGIEGQPARVRIDGGRVVTGRATAQRRVEVML